MKASLRAVLVGCGGISTVWFKALEEIPGVALVGLIDLNEAACHRRREEYRLNEAKVGSDLNAMLRATRPDIVFDCTVPGARASVVLAALKQGCHVLSEKPMATSMGEARRLIGAARKAGRLFAVMQNRRYDPHIRALKNFLAAGKIGELTTLNGDFYLGAHFGGFREQMRHVLLLDMAIHSFDQARLIAGADPVSVYCQEWNPRGSWYAHDASAVAMFEMSNGIFYTYRGSWCAEGLNTTWECDWRAVGTRGSVTWNGNDQFRAQGPAKNEEFIRPMRDLAVSLRKTSGKTGHAGCILDFLESIRTGRAPETVCTDNIKSLAMVFGAIKSAEAGRKVAISSSSSFSR
jgi:predicted dehydrogenase